MKCVWLIALGILNGVVLEAQASLAEASAADAVIVGSGMQTREVVADAGLMAQLQLDPRAGNCSARSARVRWCWPSWACSAGCRPAPI